MTYLSLNDEVEGASYMKVTDGALTREFKTLRLPLGTGLLGPGRADRGAILHRGLPGRRAVRAPPLHRRRRGRGADPRHPGRAAARRGAGDRRAARGPPHRAPLPRRGGVAADVVRGPRLRGAGERPPLRPPGRGQPDDLRPRVVGGGGRDGARADDRPAARRWRRRGGGGGARAGARRRGRGVGPERPAARRHRRRGPRPHRRGRPRVGPLGARDRGGPRLGGGRRRGGRARRDGRPARSHHARSTPSSSARSSAARWSPRWCWSSRAASRRPASDSAPSCWSTSSRVASWTRPAARARPSAHLRPRRRARCWPRRSSTASAVPLPAPAARLAVQHRGISAEHHGDLLVLAPAVDALAFGRAVREALGEQATVGVAATDVGGVPAAYDSSRRAATALRALGRTRRRGRRLVARPGQPAARRRLARGGRPATSRRTSVRCWPTTRRGTALLPTLEAWFDHARLDRRDRRGRARAPQHGQPAAGAGSASCSARRGASRRARWRCRWRCGCCDSRNCEPNTPSSRNHGGSTHGRR